MSSFYRASVEEFLAQNEEQVLARLGIAYANRGYTSQYTDQTLTWEQDISLLRRSLEQCVIRSDSARSWGLLLEFSIPRKEMRIDIVLLIRDVVVVLEAKTGDAASQARRQIEEYALLLHYFHKASTERRIVPIILVQVLQYLFTQESMRGGAKAAQARAEAKTLIENVHVFARYHTDDNLGEPSNHAIIFDEAQRAWNRAQNMRKFGRDYSEPEMLLRIMERHLDWAVVVALVGGGQEINDGEAGLEEWGRALIGSAKDWVIYASPEVLDGGASTAGHRLFDDPARQKKVRTSSALHLRTSHRSLRAEQLATWVNLLLEGDANGAASLQITQRYPIFLSRKLEETRLKLQEQGIGTNRYGLVGSSGAARLRAEGLEPNSTFHADYPWEHWYLAEATDVRSSYRCEVFATEFEIQGLELDWIGLCWGGDFVWHDSQGWQLRALRHGPQSKWSAIKSFEKQTYRRNAYRVLLTRARQGMIIFVPKGSASDPTNRSDEFETTAQYLVRCGVTPLG